MFPSPATPIILLSEFRRVLLANPSSGLPPDPEADLRLRDLIADDSMTIQQWCGRRFDEYMDTRGYTPQQIEYGGDLTGINLTLDADLKTLTALTNADDTPIDITQVILLPVNTSLKHILHLNNRTLNNFWMYGNNDPTGRVKVQGIWGYGGYWLPTIATVNANYADPTTALLTVTNPAALEVGMMLKVVTGTAPTQNTEYLSVLAVDTVGLTILVNRAANGSTAAPLTTGLMLYRFMFNEVVRGAMKRLIAWRNEQTKSPLFGTASIGDMTFPLRVDSIPADVQKMMYDGGLRSVILPTAI